ncbi:DUF397 domain-containing protein [Streptomyces sp. NBC_00996]|uniref:DUF397 domain-containing protein n=1 Tax=Streptomyces sp. NBC_00996 TaxID=2903710 RepID=UPI00386FDC93|nr:DUF397 domain-containing protein [Streptomyces sp. NBC_00996]
MRSAHAFPPLTWQKSSFSGGGTTDDCVELATPETTPIAIHLRESDSPATILTTNHATLKALLTTLKRGNGVGER